MLPWISIDNSMVSNAIWKEHVLSLYHEFDGLVSLEAFERTHERVFFVVATKNYVITNE